MDVDHLNCHHPEHMDFRNAANEVAGIPNPRMVLVTTESGTVHFVSSYDTSTTIGVLSDLINRLRSQGSRRMTSHLN